MIFIWHYLLLNTGLPAIIILITLFLQTHTDASLSEIGALLMALPFVSILIKPLFCALADRHRAHKLYLIYALALVALGYGSLSVAPFFPQFVATHGRLVWYLDVVAIIIGFSAFGVVWSLGDALAMNYAQRQGVTWGSYRAWGVVAWGAGGIIIGQINELPFLPKYVPMWFVLITFLIAEIILLTLWPNEDFVIGGAAAAAAAAAAQSTPQVEKNGATASQQQQQLEDLPEVDNCSTTGTIRGTARANPRVIGAVANVFMEDLGGTIRSSLRFGSTGSGAGVKKRAGLDSMLEHVASISEVKVLDESNAVVVPAAVPAAAPAPVVEPVESPADVSQTTSTGMTFGKATLRRTQRALARMNSLSAATGHAIALEAHQLDCSFDNNNNNNSSSTAGTPIATTGTLRGRHHVMYMSSLASNASLSKATAAARALALKAGGESPLSPTLTMLTESQVAPSEEKASSLQVKLDMVETCADCGPSTTSAEDLQIVLLKLIVRRDKSIRKYLFVFTVLGALFTCHLSYFFLHLESMCRERGSDFASVMGSMLAAHSVSEFLSFTVIAPNLTPLIGRAGSLLTCSILFAIRFAYYGTYLTVWSPFTGVPFELVHGLVYGILYSQITDIAFECVNQVDLYLPELVERKIVGAHIEAAQLKLQLRATMQGLFSGAFDGLGNGIGALAGGLYLDAYSFTQLWLACTYVCLTLIVVYILTDWRAILAGGDKQRRPVAH